MRAGEGLELDNGKEMVVGVGRVGRVVELKYGCWDFICVLIVC